MGHCTLPVAFHWWLISTGGDNTLDEEKVVTMASLLSSFQMNSERIIDDGIRYRVRSRPRSSHFHAWLLSYVNLARVPILVGIDEEIEVMKKFDIEKIKDNTA